MNNFHSRLRKLREKKTQEEVASAIGITRAALSYYEKGERTPDVKFLHNICKYYNISSDYLIGIDNDLSDYERLKKENKKLKEKISQIKQIAELD